MSNRKITLMEMVTLEFWIRNNSSRSWILCSTNSLLLYEVASSNGRHGVIPRYSYWCCWFWGRINLAVFLPTSIGWWWVHFEKFTPDGDGPRAMVAMRGLCLDISAKKSLVEPRTIRLRICAAWLGNLKCSLENSKTPCNIVVFCRRWSWFVLEHTLHANTPSNKTTVINYRLSIPDMQVCMLYL